MEKIILVKHDEKWEREFEEEKNILSDVFRGIFFNIHHVGSTAVPDLLSKPIIYIAVESFEFPPAQNTLEMLSALEYQNREVSGVKGRIWFTKGTPRKFNMHLCALGSDVIKSKSSSEKGCDVINN